VAGKVERGSELILVIKTTTTRLNALEKCVLANHPYDTPEFVVLPISSGNRRYLEWISGSVNR
jgi:periplasmic divalent cation tolerance protein